MFGQIYLTDKSSFLFICKNIKYHNNKKKSIYISVYIVGQLNWALKGFEPIMFLYCLSPDFVGGGKKHIFHPNTLLSHTKRWSSVFLPFLLAEKIKSLNL